MAVSPPERREFEERASRLVWEWADRRNRQMDSESPNAWFKRNSYAFLRPYVEKGRQEVFRAIAKQDRRPSRLVSEALSNPFKLGLLAMFSDDTLKRSDRHVFGNQMLYAYLHDVPPEFLNGFLAISGGPGTIARKLKQNFVEPGFENRPRRAFLADIP